MSLLSNLEFLDSDTIIHKKPASRSSISLKKPRVSLAEKTSTDYVVASMLYKYVANIFKIVRGTIDRLRLQDGTSLTT